MAEQNQTDKDQRVDQLLDSLLATYSDAEPRPGLETRILASVREQAARRKTPGVRLTWLWTSVGAAAAIAILVAVLTHRSAGPAQPPTVAKTPPAPQVNLKATVDTPVQRHIPGSKRPEQAVEAQPVEASVRGEIFPTPAPLSEQEALLLRYLRMTPREEVVAQSHIDQPPEGFEEDQPPAPQAKSGIPQSINTR